MRRAQHPDGQQCQGCAANAERHECRRTVPRPLLSRDRADDESPHGQRGQEGAGYVEAPRRARIPAFADVPPGHPQRDQDERHIDQEHRPPRDRVHQQASEEGTEDRESGRGAGPDPKRTPLFLAAEGGRNERQRPGNEKGAGRALHHAERHQPFQGGGQATEDRGRAEPDDPQDEHPAPAVDIGQAAGQNQERALRQEIAVVDVGLPFQDAKEMCGHVAPDPGERDRHHAGVQEHDARPENRRPERPALVGHDRRSGVGVRETRSPSVPSRPAASGAGMDLPWREARAGAGLIGVVSLLDRSATP